ncbi:MAG: deoxyribonuclease IV [Bacilli bacterium]|nr:deoxyribonuclease IV [Bacilli bacterium]
MYLGSHVGLSGPEYYLGSVKEALSYNANTFMFYTGAPQNSYRKSTKEMRIEEGRALIKEAGIDESKIVVHAPYIMNPGNYGREDLYQMTKEFIIRELERSEEFNATILVLHPGASVGLDRDECIVAIGNLLNYCFEATPNNKVRIALETMSGKGTELGITFEEIRRMIDLVKPQYQSRIGVCLDTCHIHDAGYDINDVDGILKEFDEVIGLNKLLVVHINDSKNPRGAHKDRHENIGYGYIGFTNIYKFVHHPLLRDIPKILETPYYKENPPYKEEIEELRSGEFTPTRETIASQSLLLKL